MKKLNLPIEGESDISNWKAYIHKLNNPSKTVTIGLVGKYVELKDAYISIHEAIKHAGVSNDCAVEIKSIHSESIKKSNVAKKFKGLAGIIVAPGFGDRGIEGKILAIQYARENKVPFFGICLGMQCAVIEFARNVLGLKGAHSLEMDAFSPHPVINIMANQENIENMGGTMRLGAYDCVLKPDSLASELYGQKMIAERHRHRFEFNNKYLQQFETAGMTATGIYPTENLVEIVEIANHPFFIGVQFHPEYSSTVAKPHPLFKGFVKHVLLQKAALSN